MTTTKVKMLPNRSSRTGCFVLAIVITTWLVPGRASAQFVLKNRPSLRIGKVLRVDLRAKVQGDFRTFSPDLRTDEGAFDLNRARLGLEGTFFKHLDYQV